MCIEALGRAFRVHLEPSSLKFVLVALADLANAKHGMRCWPSVSHLCDVTSQDRKTVLENVQRLIALGYLQPTDERVGVTKSIKVYILNLPETFGDNRRVPKSGSLGAGAVENVNNSGDIDDAANQAIPKTVSFDETEKQSRFSAEAVPKTGHGTLTDPLLKPARVTSAEAVPKTASFEDEKNATTATKEKPNDRKARKPANRGTTLPGTWQPNEGHREKCAAAGIDIGKLVEEFTDYHTARGTVFKDWDAGFRTWISRAPRYGAQGGQRPGNSGSRNPSIVEAGMRVANRFAAQGR